MDGSPDFANRSVGLSRESDVGKLATREGIFGKIAAISLGMSGNRLEERSRLARFSASKSESKEEVLVEV